MSDQTWQDEVLMAFADGELDTETAARIEAAMETDEALAARVAMFMDTGNVARLALQPLLDEPVPQALAQSVRNMAGRQDNVLAFGRRTTPRVQRWMSLAASFLAVAAAGYLAGRAMGTADGPTGTVPAPLAGILDAEPSGALAETASGTVRLIASFPDQAGRLCREYEVTGEDRSTVLGIACRSDGRWETRLAIATPALASGYAPASSVETVDAFLAAMNAGPVLSAEEERKALSVRP